MKRFLLMACLLVMAAGALAEKEYRDFTDQEGRTIRGCITGYNAQKQMVTIERDNDKNPVVALREIADETQSADGLRERLIEANQTQIEVDEPEEDQMNLLMSGEHDRPAEDDMSEEKLLRALMEAQRQG